MPAAQSGEVGPGVMIGASLLSAILRPDEAAMHSASAVSGGGGGGGGDEKGQPDASGELAEVRQKCEPPTASIPRSSHPYNNRGLPELPLAVYQPSPPCSISQSGYLRDNGRVT
jgi:hypothetical protein